MAVRIASFNMKRWGNGSKRDLEAIANIIRGEDLDVVAFQEIFSAGAGIKELVQYHLYNWDFCWGEPKETTNLTKMENKRGEGYAYIWNKRKFKLTKVQALSNQRQFEPRIINSLSNDVTADCSDFVRTPYYIRLEPLYGGFWELRLINIHIFFGRSDLSCIQKRQEEYRLLTQEIYPQISQKRYGNFRFAYTIAMGDYNLNIICPLSQARDRNASLIDEVTVPGFGQVKTIQLELTTLKNEQDGYANNYDHFTYSLDRMPFSAVSCGPIDAVNKYYGARFEEYKQNVSDHLPIVMEFLI